MEVGVNNNFTNWPKRRMRKMILFLLDLSTKGNVLKDKHAKLQLDGNSLQTWQSSQISMKKAINTFSAV